MLSLLLLVLVLVLVLEERGAVVTGTLCTDGSIPHDGAEVKLLLSFFGLFSVEG